MRLLPCVGFCVGGLVLGNACAGPERLVRIEGEAPSSSSGKPEAECAECVRHPVRATLLECERLDVTSVEEVLANGRIVEPLWKEAEYPRLRLHVQLTNVGSKNLHVAMCHGRLHVTEVEGRRDTCFPVDAAWSLFPPGSKTLVYPTIVMPQRAGVFVETLFVERAGVPDARLERMPDAISYELTPHACEPVLP
jgi:hypothetical protein